MKIPKTSPTLIRHPVAFHLPNLAIKLDRYLRDVTNHPGFVRFNKDLEDEEFGQDPIKLATAHTFNRQPLGESELVGTIYGVPPHIDTHVPEPWSHFLVLRNEGFRLQTICLDDLAGCPDRADLPGELMSLNIHQPHWVSPVWGTNAGKLWIALCINTKTKVEPEVLRDAFTRHVDAILSRANLPPAGE